jgi:hypothetical protein
VISSVSGAYWAGYFDDTSTPPRGRNLLKATSRFAYQTLTDIEPPRGADIALVVRTASGSTETIRGLRYREGSVELPFGPRLLSIAGIYLEGEFDPSIALSAPQPSTNYFTAAATYDPVAQMVSGIGLPDESRVVIVGDIEEHRFYDKHEYQSIDLRELVSETITSVAALHLSVDSSESGDLSVINATPDYLLSQYTLRNNVLAVRAAFVPGSAVTVVYNTQSVGTTEIHTNPMRHEYVDGTATGHTKVCYRLTAVRSIAVGPTASARIIESASSAAWLLKFDPAA